MAWSGGARPAWVRHAIAGEGGPRYHAAARPLVPAELMAEAELVTGLSDWGGDDLAPALDVLTSALESESRLHLVGRYRARHDLRHALENRLRMTAYAAADPGLAAERVERPVIVTGSPRAGTSILHELLALLPGLRAPLAWEYWWPAPPCEPGSAAEATRVALAGDDARFTAALAPQFDGMHEQGALVPREDPAAMLPTARSDILHTYYAVPSYQEWLRDSGMRPAYEYHNLVLRTLQRRWPHPRPTWVCKAPSHAAQLELLLELYPDARIVVCHRDPLAMLSSVTSLTATLRWAHSDSVDFAALARENADQFGRNLDTVLDLRQRGVLTDRQCVDVRFHDFVADQVGTIRRIAGHFGLPFDDDVGARLRDHLRAKPRGRHGGHDHSPDRLGLDLAALRRRFADYLDYFGIEAEVG
ncbi:MAG: sulfotransferase [Frankia sp.]|nr:sulfotransferase [Frankia sp.]